MSEKLTRYLAQRKRKIAQRDKIQQEIDELDKLVREEENAQIVAIVRKHAIDLNGLAEMIREQNEKKAAPFLMSQNHAEEDVNHEEEL